LMAFQSFKLPDNMDDTTSQNMQILYLWRLMGEGGICFSCLSLVQAQFLLFKSITCMFQTTKYIPFEAICMLILTRQHPFPYIFMHKLWDTPFFFFFLPFAKQENPFSSSCRADQWFVTKA
jgi:hypothetical protein